MSFVCRRGHHSISDDFCDVCGAKNRDVRQSFNSIPHPVGPSVHPCPVCSTPRDAAGRYCLNCGYDFITGERFGPIIPEPSEIEEAPPARVAWGRRPMSSPPGEAPPQTAPPPRAARPRQPIPSSRLVVVVSVDPTRTDGGGESERWPDPSGHVFNLDGSSMMIGRADAPGLQIPIRGDPYVSRQHAELVELGGRWGVRDLGSTNGTRLNGAPLVGTEVKPIEAGDVIEIGYFSRLTILSAQL